MFNSDIIENIIVGLARQKHDSRLKCFCEERMYHTICVSLEEIKLKCNSLKIQFSNYEDLFCYEFKREWYDCFPRYYMPIIDILKKRIKYETFSRYNTRVKKVYISDHDGFIIVFEVKK
jgi:hypothetical protein